MARPKKEISEFPATPESPAAKAPGKDEGRFETRERIDLQYQVLDHIRIIRMSWTLGDLLSLGRAIDVLRTLLGQWMDVSQVTRYDKAAILYAPVTAEKFQSADDLEKIRIYGTLMSQRADEINNAVMRENRVRFYQAKREEMNVLMSVVKDLGLGFELQGPPEEV
jgi:hypothetical protein